MADEPENNGEETPADAKPAAKAKAARKPAAKAKAKAATSGSAPQDGEKQAAKARRAPAPTKRRPDWPGCCTFFWSTRAEAGRRSWTEQRRLFAPCSIEMTA